MTNRIFDGYRGLTGNPPALPCPRPPVDTAAHSGGDPKQGAGAQKIPLSVIPPAVLFEIGAAMAEGAIKYDPHNWRTSGGVVVSTYINACLRHLLAFAMGEDIDPDTVAADGTGGVSHLAKAMASAAVLRDAILHGQAIDDRPPPTDPAIIAALTLAYRGMVPRAEAARAKLATPKP